MIDKTISELIVRWYGRPREEFLEVYDSPVLVGIGVLDVELLRDPHRIGTTLCLGFQCTSDEGAQGHPLVGCLLPFPSESFRSGARVIIGRVPECAVVVEDQAVSSEHCALEQRGHGVVVLDLDSTNGTFVNGTPVEPDLAVNVEDEDVLTLGRYSFQFFSPEVLYTYLQLSPPTP